MAKANREKVGIVVGDKMIKTRIIAVNDRVISKRYGKVVTRTKRYAVHDSTRNSCIGDKVKIVQTYAISKTKNWVVTDILGTKRNLD